MLIVISPVVLSKYLGLHLSKSLPVWQMALLQTASKMQCGAYTVVVRILTTAYFTAETEDLLLSCRCHQFVL